VSPDAAAKHLSDQRGDAWRRLIVNTDEDVAGSDSGAMARGEYRNSLCTEPGCSFDPPDSVGWNIEAALPVEVHGRKNAGGDSCYSEYDSQNPGLGRVVHERNRQSGTWSAHQGPNQFRPRCTIREAFAVPSPTKNHNLFRNTRGCCIDYAANKEIVLIICGRSDSNFRNGLPSYGINMKVTIRKQLTFL